MPRGDARRKIFFYRCLSPDGAPLDKAALCAAIESLGDPYHDLDESIVRAEVYSSDQPQCIRFFKVRRDDLPAKDDGHGDHEDLDLDPDEGLAEAIHLCLYPYGIIAAEFFFYGPRIERFGRFINQKLGMDYEISPVIRSDVIERALSFGDIRLLRFKIHPSEISRGAADDMDFDGLVATANNFDAGVFAELTLRSEGNDEGFRDKVRQLLTKILDRDEGTAMFDKLEIEGKPTPDQSVAPLDLLSERLYRSVEIPYAAARTRELSAPRAFDAIRTAYRQVASELPRDGLG